MCRPEQYPWRDAGMGLQGGQALHVRIAFKGCSHGLDERTTDYGIAFIRDFMVFSQSQRILGLRGRLTRIDCNVGSRAGALRFPLRLHDGKSFRRIAVSAAVSCGSCSQVVFRLITLCRNAWVRNGWIRGIEISGAWHSYGVTLARHRASIGLYTRLRRTMNAHGEWRLLLRFHDLWFGMRFRGGALR